MKFADIKNDVAFRKIFGNKKKTKILISFLNAVLQLEGTQRIASVKIENPYQFPRIAGEKSSIIDVRATEESGRQFVIEMQVTEPDGFDKRVQYYASRDYSMQIDKGEDYTKLKPTVFIGILNFSYFSGEDYLSYHSLLDEKTYENKLRDIRFAFIELPKFRKKESELKSLIDKWTYFIKNAPKLGVIPDNVDDEGLREAYLDADRHKWKKAELIAYDNASIAEQDERGKITAAEKKGEEKKETEAVLGLNRIGLANDKIADALTIPVEKVIQIIKNQQHKYVVRQHVASTCHRICFVHSFVPYHLSIRTMKHTFILILLVLAATLSFAQQPLKHCGHDLLLDQMEQQSPGYRDAVRQTFETVKNTAGISSRNNNLLEVQVVVHIVWKNAPENLPDSVIEDQIRVLNEDFNDLNADQINIRPVFDSVRGNAMIHFNLYEVRRVYTNQTFSIGLTGLPDGKLKSTANGGSDAVDPEHFINIWVCNLGSIGLLGYAFPPNNLPNWPEEQGANPVGHDGLVIDYRAFGSNNPNPLNLQGMSLEVKGRTPVHEMGHYLGLRHIWGDNPNPLSALLGLPNDCQQSDGIDDTPFASKQSESDCSHTQDGCTGAEAYYGVNVPDMVENHMDYSSEACQVMFTRGQAALMRGVLEGPRAGLLAPVTSTAAPVAGDLSFSLSPNPSQGIFSIDFGKNIPESAQINVYAPFGRLLFSQKMTTARPYVDLSAFPAGMYQVEVRTERGNCIRKAVVR